MADPDRSYYSAMMPEWFTYPV